MDIGTGKDLADYTVNDHLIPYHLIDIPSYTTSYNRKSADMPGELPFMPVVMSRGCPQSCSFCQAAIVAGHKVRAMSPGKVLDELEHSGLYF